MKISLGLLLSVCSVLAFGQESFRSLTAKNWSFRNAKDSQWLPAQVPGTVHTDLMANRVIADPYKDLNEKKVQWIEKEDWDYQTSFQVSAEELKNDHADLVFDGLDTFAEVRLNGQKILSADNMFRQWRVPVKNLLKAGENELNIQFISSVNQGNELAKAVPFETPETPRAFVRKAQYQFGWDWGPRLVTAGIWKDVRLDFWNQARLENLKVEQTYLGTKKANLLFHLDVKADQSGTYELAVNDKVVQKIKLKKGENQVAVPFEVTDPQWWQPNGWGEAKLYDFKIDLKSKDKTLASREVQHGFRTVELVQEPDEVGSSFYFKVNGKPLYIKGSNWIPGDSFLPRMTEEKYQKLIGDAKAAHMNMIRVWGGGAYEDEAFYRACDENGILVWQDFMFAGSFYPSDETFLNNVKEEVTYQVNRLQNHPSVAIWCGNNEIDEAIVNWGYQKAFKYSKADSLQVWKDYRKVFEELIPNTLTKVLPANKNIYVSTSPKYGWGHKESLQQADSHYWGVWHGEETLETYNKKVGRFMSEYGFLAMPTLPMVDAMFSEKPVYALDNEVIRAHQKHGRGWELVRMYMERDFVVPEDFVQYDYVSQLLQSRAMRIAIDAHRRNQPYNMGTLIWQLNDCWPVASWSAIDYLGNWKALQYQTLRSYEPLTVQAYEEEGKIELYVIDDAQKLRENPALKIELLNMQGRVLKSLEANYTGVADKHILKVATLDKKELLGELDESNLVLRVQLQGTNASVLHFFSKPKDLKLENPNIRIRQISDHAIEISAEALAKDVYLMGDTHFSDNFFDLLPGETRRIELTQALNEIKVMSLFDTMNNKQNE